MTEKAVSRAERWGMVLVILAGAGLRIAGIAHGLPLIQHADEKHLVERAMIMGGGDLNPHFFDYPTLLIYANLLLDIGLYLAWRILGIVASPEEFALRFFSDPTPQYLLGRLLSVAAGVASLVLVWNLGRRLASPRVGFLAASLLAFAPLHVFYSQIAKADIPMAMFVVLAHLTLLRWLRTGANRDAVWSGVAMGLAAATKYNAGLLGATLLVAVLLRRRREARSAVGVLTDRRLWAASGSALAAFLAVSPYVLMDSATFFADLRRVSAEVRYDEFGFEGIQSAWIHHLMVSLGQGFGLLPLGLAVVGLAWMVRSNPGEGLLLLVFPLLTLLTIGTWHLAYARYALPVLPLLTIPAAVTLDRLAGSLSRARDVTTALLLAAVLALPAADSIRIARLFAGRNTRDAAREWIERRIPSGSVIAMDRYGPPLAEAPEAFLARQAALGRAKTLATRGMAQHLRARPVHYQLVDAEVAGFNHNDLRSAGVAYVVTSSFVRDRYLAAADRHWRAATFYQALEREALLLARFSPCGEPCRGSDAPYQEMSLMTRLERRRAGPTILVYRLGGKATP